MPPAQLSKSWAGFRCTRFNPFCALCQPPKTSSFPGCCSRGGGGWQGGHALSEGTRYERAPRCWPRPRRPPTANSTSPRVRCGHQKQTVSSAVQQMHGHTASPVHARLECPQQIPPCSISALLNPRPGLALGLRVACQGPTRAGSSATPPPCCAPQSAWCTRQEPVQDVGSHSELGKARQERVHVALQATAQAPPLGQVGPPAGCA